ncbi:MAG: FAD-dependent oxidoreductase [Armatimonadota bacterium]
MEIREEARETPVVYSCDVCVIGGSCTGLLAAVRAAQAGARVALVEQNGYFGGEATAGLVNVWHSLRDTQGERQIIGGLTKEILDRLGRWGAVTGFENHHYQFNSAALTLELDGLVREHPSIRPFLHARFVAPIMEEGRVTHVVIEDKTGRRAIQARYFVDASGEGDLAFRAGLPSYTLEDIQPPTTCVHLYGLDEVEAQNPGFDLGKTVYDPRYPNALKTGVLWWAQVPGVPGVRMIAGTRVHHADCSDADTLTAAEMEGRRQVRAMIDIVRENFPGGDKVMPVTLPSYIGIRETRHISCEYQLTEEDVLEGSQFPDAVANGTYRVDIHHSAKAGVTMRYLDGRECLFLPDQPIIWSRWREPREQDPTFYQIPYRCLVPKGSRNVLVAGRLIDADRGAFSAIRVMVNCNQTGEAAGMTCALACEKGCDVSEIDPVRMQQALVEQGAIIGSAMQA